MRLVVTRIARVALWWALGRLAVGFAHRFGVLGDGDADLGGTQTDIAQALDELAERVRRRDRGFCGGRGGHYRCRLRDDRKGRQQAARATDDLERLVVQPPVRVVHAVHQRVTDPDAVDELWVHEELPDDPDALSEFAEHLRLLLIQPSRPAAEIGALEHLPRHRAVLADVHRLDLHAVVVVRDGDDSTGIGGDTEAECDAGVSLETFEGLGEPRWVGDGGDPDRRFCKTGEALGFECFVLGLACRLHVTLQTSSQDIDHVAVQGIRHGLPHDALLVSQWATQSGGVLLTEQVLHEDEDRHSLVGPPAELASTLLEGEGLLPILEDELEGGAGDLEEVTGLGDAVDHLVQGEDGGDSRFRLLFATHDGAMLETRLCRSTAIPSLQLFLLASSDALAGTGTVATLLATRGGFLLLCHVVSPKVGVQ